MSWTHEYSADERAAFALRRSALAVTKSLVEPFEQVLRGLGNDGAGWKYRISAGLAQSCEVLGRDDAADDDHRIFKTELAERTFQRRHQGEVAGGK